MSEQLEHKVKYQDENITVTVAKMLPEWWPQYYYLFRARDKDNKKECSICATSLEQLDAFIEDAKVALTNKGVKK